MKKRIAYLLIAIATIASCKKQGTDDQLQPPSAMKNTPTCAYFNVEQTSQGWRQFIYFFDLRSKETASKKYFKMELKYIGVKDSFEIVGSPRSMDSLSKGFPAEIQSHIGYGWVHQWTNSSYRLLRDGSNQFYKDTIVRNPQSNIYFLHLFYQTGSLAGKWPQSNLDAVVEPLGNGQVRRHFRTIFWFKEGLCYDAHDGATMAEMKSINSYTRGSAGYDWTNVSSAVQIGNGSQFQNIYFFDFTNWRYFKWEFYVNNIPGSISQPAVIYHGYKSLDEFMTWPEGWGKK
ncbi:MAG: hypothetical protein H7Y31_10015 [Chitinophagaceae bacterium]|nr:hypothetical protein [Chitinophagaceae bacterium]